MPNPKNPQHIVELRNSLEELNISNDIIYQLIENLINEAEFNAIKKDTGNVSSFKTKEARDNAIKRGTHGAVEGGEKDEKKTKVSKTLLQSPPDKESTSARNKRRLKINEETDAIIKESGGDIQVVYDIIKKRRETLDNLWDKPAGGGGSLIGEMYGGISAEEIAHNSDLTEEEFVEDKMKRLKGPPKTALYIELEEKAKSTRPPTNPDKYVGKWLSNAYRTGKSEIDYLKSEPKFKYKNPQTKPFPVGVTMDYNQRQTVKSTFEAKLEEARKNGDKEAVAHYEKQLRILDKLEDTDTGLLYETSDGRIGFKHTSNKNGWNDPHNNTSVRVKGEKIKAISETVARQNNLTPEQEKTMNDDIVKTINEGAEIVDNAEKVVEKDIENVDTDEFTKNNSEAFRHVDPRSINYVERTRQEPSVRTHLEAQGIDPDNASDEEILKACVELVKSGKATADVKKIVLKLSDLTEKIRKLKEKGLKSTGPMSDEQIAKHLGIPESVVKIQQNEVNDGIRETSRKRKNSMEVAHERIVTGLFDSDKRLAEETGESYFPDPEDAPNGPATQAYVNSFMDDIHFTRYIDGDLEGIQSINIDGTNVTPDHFRNCLTKLSGFKGDPHSPEGKEALKTHLRKTMRVSPDGTAITFNSQTEDGKSVEVGQEVYRTKGNAKSILAHLGKDIQKCLKKEAGAK